VASLNFYIGKLKVSELFFEVPKDYSNPSDGTLRLFARSVTRHEVPVAPTDEKELKKKAQMPWMTYLQGGPGYPCRPPQSMSITNPILDRGYQMLYLDQRGTGLSTPVSPDTLALQGDPQKQADYLKHFRADNIVRDCEAIRKTLTEDYPPELKKWSIFGQSFGGFCAFTYLSFFPEGLREVFTSGGIPPIGKSADEVYKATFMTVIKRNESYYNKYPEDVFVIQNLAVKLHGPKGLELPARGTLNLQRFLTLGLLFGGHGGIDNVHDIVFRMKSDMDQFDFITRPTLSAIENLVTFDGNVLYAVLHEAIYCERQPSEWAAKRIAQSLSDFDWVDGSPPYHSIKSGKPLYFSGEMIYPFMFETYPELQKLREVADILAKYTDWPELYNLEQLAKNEVPIYAATFKDDMYVDFGLVQETVAKVKNCRLFLTNAMYHNAITAKTDEILKSLFQLRDDYID
jgi:pimeloyl-ACP methyl ester carboxylesterase